MICFRDKSNVLIASVFFAFQVTKLAITQIAKIYWSTNQVLKKFGEWLSQLLFFQNSDSVVSQSMVVRKGEIEIEIGNIIWF